MPNAWQDYAALIIAFYNKSGITASASFIFLEEDFQKAASRQRTKTGLFLWMTREVVQ